jgi:cobalt-zinc-cadmium efflux system protein
VLCLALGYSAIELVGGYLTGSLALLADAVHMVSDAAALAIALFAIWMGERPPSDRRTFGHRRAEILAALANGLALTVVAVFITIHAFERFLEPRNVEGAGVVLVATGGLAINLLCLVILEGGRKESLNVRGAWLHVASDTLASVGVIAAGLGIWAFGLNCLIREALDVLMEAVPSHLDPEEIRAMLLDVPEVSALHCLHVWTIGSGEVSLSSHLVVGPGREAETLLQDVRSRLSELFGIDHTTIQIEIAAPGRPDEISCGEPCEPITMSG